MNYIKKVNKIFSIKNIFSNSLKYSLILITIDKFDILTKIVNELGWYILIIISLLLLLRILLGFGLKSIFCKNINISDKVFFITLITSINYYIYIHLFDYSSYKAILFFILIICSLVFLTTKLFINKKKEIEYKSNILDLNELCKSKEKLKLSSSNKCFIEDVDVDYDLLNRKNTINHLYNAIIDCRPEKNYTIGLEGKWGVGKTTIINNVLRLLKKNGMIEEFNVVKFDPWKYNDEKTMLNAFIKSILKEIGYDIRAKESIEIVENVLCNILGNGSNNIIKQAIVSTNSFQSEEKLEEIVNDYLITNDKRLIIIIDNLDRVDSQKAIFLIKCIETLVDFKRTISVLLYDEEIIDKILSEKFNSKNNYMAKIVQLRVKVPEINYEILNNLKNTIANKIIIDNIDLYDAMSKIFMKFDDIRQLKLFFNIILTYPYDEFNLNLIDDLCLKYIRIRCPKLYYEIWNNKNYFISYDRGYDTDLTEIFLLDKINDDCKKYFEKFVNEQEFKDFDGILKNMFDTYDNFVNDRDPFNQYGSKEIHNESIRNNRISNARYFDLYFTREENDFTRLNHQVNELIELINNQPDNKYEIYLDELFKSYSFDEIRVFSEILQLHEESIKPERCYNLVITLLNKLNVLADRPLPQLDSLSRVSCIVADVVLKLDMQELEKLIQYLKGKYKFLSIIDNVQYWIEYNKKNGKEYKKDFSGVISEMCEEILKKNINILDDENYYKKNIWTLYRYCKDNLSRLSKYLKKAVNENNIFKYLSSQIAVIYGEGISYRINTVNNELLNIINIEKILKKHPNPLSETEKLILDIYNYSMKATDPFDSFKYDKYISF